jgi:hypothetical protein
MAQVFFHEKQSIPSAWRIIIFIFVTLMMGFVFLMTYLTEWDTMPAEEKPYLFTLLAGPIAVLILFFISMEVRITQESFEYKVLPFRKNFKKISFRDIADIELVQLSGFKSFRRFGVNQRLNRQEYNFGGHHLLTISLKNGKSLSFTTFKPKEMAYFLNNLPENVGFTRKLPA